MIFEFDQFQLNTHTSTLHMNGEELALEPRVFDLLLYLIEQRERVVSKDEIVEHIWQGRYTSDTAIATCIKSLRKVLQDDGTAQRYIKTQRGRGFRFVAKVQQLEDLPKAPLTSNINQSNDTSIFISETLQPDAVIYQGKPSVIVLPFQALNVGEVNTVVPEAMAHELIQALSRLRWLKVIARGTAFRFQMPHVDLNQIGQQLNVRYALCGIIEGIGEKQIISVELSDCKNSDVIWAERFETRIDDLHEVRSRIVASVIASLETYIPLNEASHASLLTTENLDAWANYHLGLRHMFRFTQADNARAAHYFQVSMNQDAQFARAHAGLSFTRFQDAFLNYDSDSAKAIADARILAERGVELDPLDPFTNYNMGRSFWLEGDPDGASGWLERSVTLSPNFAQGHYSCAFTALLHGQASGALQASNVAIHLSPLDPLLYAIYGVRALCHLRLGDYEQAVIWAEKSACAPRAHYLIFMIAATIYALAGNIQKARYWQVKTLKTNPEASVQNFFKAFPFLEPEFCQVLRRGLAQVEFQ